MCHDEWSGPGAPASLLRRILSSHRLDNASCDNARKTVPSISTIHTFVYVYLRHSLSHFFFHFLRKYRTIYFRSRCHTSEALLDIFLDSQSAMKYTNIKWARVTKLSVLESSNYISKHNSTIFKIRSTAFIFFNHFLMIIK